MNYFVSLSKAVGVGPWSRCLRLLHAPTAIPRLLQHLAALRFLTVLQQLIALESEQKSDVKHYSLPFSERGTSLCRSSTISTASCIAPWKSTNSLMMMMMAEG
jgi:hypothetical protein